MQEHGVLERVLLIYDEAAGRIERGEQVDLSAITGAAGIVRRFVEDYHERLEEQFLFPRFEAAGRERELVATLRLQHERGRALTAEILARAPRAEDRAQLVTAVRAFARMYRPHAAREDSVLFVELRNILPPDQILKIGGRMEEDEKKVLGEGGFERFVNEVAEIEKRLGLYNLAQFTPQD
jgi:hemerythrin-like domain-containing protein